MSSATSISYFRLQTEGRRHVRKQLAEDGLRPALPNEAGWYTLVEMDNRPHKIWATDETLPDIDGVDEVDDLFEIYEEQQAAKWAK